MKVRFSRLAVFKLERLLEYLEEEWSEKSKLKFIEELNGQLQTIEQFPFLNPSSTFDPILRRCVVTKHTSFLYEVHDDSIFILTIIDNRQDQKKIWKEIKENFGFKK